MKTINNNIKEIHVNFENAKLLKEAGFEAPSNHWYHRDTKKLEIFGLNFYVNKITDNYAVQTLQLAIDWVRVNFNIYLAINFANRNQWYFDIKEIGKTSGKEYLYKSDYGYKDPNEAKQVALKYCLENLILEK